MARPVAVTWPGPLRFLRGGLVLFCPLAAWSLLDGPGSIHADGRPLPDGPGNAIQESHEHADALVWVRRGDALMQQSRDLLHSALYDQAEQAYRRALALDPHHEQALLGLAWVYNTKHDFEEGIRFARAALKIHPRLPAAHALLGDAAVELGDYDTAFEHYQETLDFRPDLSSYSRASHLVWLTGDAVKARWLMRKAIEAGGPHAENVAWCRAQLALMLLQNGALLSAEDEIGRALQEAPRNPHVLAAAGRIQTARRHYEAAIKSYLQSVTTAPTHDALAALVDLYELTGHQDEAKAQFASVVAFHTHQGGHDHGHAHAREVQADGEHAHPASSGHHHHGHDHQHPHGNAQLARFYADHNRNLDEALREARAAWANFPNLYSADALAWCLYRQGEFKEASSMIRRALQHGTPDATIHFHAGMIYAGLGNRPLAQRHLYHALNLNPHFHPTHSRLAVDTLSSLTNRHEPDSKTVPDVGEADRLEPARPHGAGQNSFDIGAGDF